MGWDSGGGCGRSHGPDSRVRLFWRVQIGGFNVILESSVKFSWFYSCHKACDNLSRIFVRNVSYAENENFLIDDKFSVQLNQTQQTQKNSVKWNLT